MPNQHVEPNCGICLPDRSIGQERRITASDAFHQFGTEPEKRSGLKLLKEIIGDKHGQAGAEESSRGALEFLKRGGPTRLVAKGMANCKRGDP